MKLLFLDIETAPNLAAVWGMWNQNVSLDQLMKPGYTLCWAAKWHNKPQVMFSSVLDGHKKMVRGIHDLMNEADAICHYNGLKFDIPTLNKEFLLLGMSPPAPSTQIDLLLTARKRFRLASNKLDFVAKQLGLGEKLKHKGFDLWLQCMAKKPPAWKTMEAYNKQDVVLLEKVYERLLPWITSHPNVTLVDGRGECPSCGSRHVQRRGVATTRARKYARYHCVDCGTWFRSTTVTGAVPGKVAIV